jgi:hypothetical protein
MRGSVQEKLGNGRGDGDLANTFGVDMVPIRGTLREAQAEARSNLHRRRGARTAKLSLTDCEHRWRIQEAVETLVPPWAAEQLEQIPTNVLIFYSPTSSEPGYMLKPMIEQCSAKSTRELEGH